jgi:formamidopyrimidine-DNA glycosylase
VPELPEVEVLVRQLDPCLRGCRVESVEVWRPKIVRPHSVAELRVALVGRVFRSVTRRGKCLQFQFRESPGFPPLTVFGHLGMTGRIYLQSLQAPLPKHVGVTVDLAEARLVFEDTRQFGRFCLVPLSQDSLGPEPLGKEFTPDVLQEAMSGSRQPLKVRLMDQSVIAGIGNIYASEALFRARISPRLLCCDLPSESLLRLWRSIRDVLEEAIQRGSSIPLARPEDRERLFHYGRTAGATSTNAPSAFQVYDREGLPCVNCGRAIERMVQAGRSTFYCEHCQRENCPSGVHPQDGIRSRRFAN